MGRIRREKASPVEPVRGVSITRNGTYQISFTPKKGGETIRETLNMRVNATNTRYCNNLKQEIDESIRKREFQFEKFFPDSVNLAKYASNPAAVTTVKDFYSKWMRDNEANFMDSDWIDRCKIINNHVISHFGHLMLSELTLPVIKTWLKDMKRKDGNGDLATKTKANRLSVLSIPLDDAVDDELIEKNPVKGYTLRKPRKAVSMEDATEDEDDDVIEPFDDEERRLILANCSGQFHNQIKFNMWTGLRPSELIALRWGDIDWVNGSMRIARKRTRNKIEATKTKAGTRDVFLCDEALAALKAQKQYTFLADKEVFHDPKTNAPWKSPAAILLAWKPVLKKAGVRYRYANQMRHTFCSVMLMNCDTIAEQQEISRAMGHKSLAFTLKTYYRFIKKDGGTSVIKKIGAKFSTKQTGNEAQ